VAAWLILLVPPAGAASYTYAPQQRGDMVATMTVELADGTGLARVYYTLTVEGGPNLQVAPPELTDPAGAWKTHRSSAWTLTGGRATWAEFIELEQEKPGVVPLPDVRLEFREGPEAAWQRAEWDDVLKDIRELPGPGPATVSAGPRALAVWGSLTAIVVLLGLTIALAMRRRRSEPSLTADERALREIRRLEVSDATPSWLFVQLSDVLRRYLTDRYGLPTPGQTTDELLQAAGREPALAGETLGELLAHCDRAKFAGLETPREEWERTAGRVRDFVVRAAKHTGGKTSSDRSGAADQAPPRS
jgi:hypothetical protein